jgi:hypothetical protein
VDKKKYIKKLSLNTVSLIDLRFIIHEEIIPQTVDDVLKYYNELFSISYEHHKQIFFHNFIKTVCEFYKKEKNCFSYIFYFNPQTNSCETLDAGVVDLTNKLNKILPIMFYCDKLPFECIDDKFTSGEMQELKEKLKMQIEKKNNKDISFRSIKLFAKKYKLTFLSEDYFNDMKVKHGLYK